MSRGMQTVYLQRWTEDLQEDMTRVDAENDMFIDCRQATRESGGLIALADVVENL
jgi:hypothetical protein